jgi:hypothetical protein
MDKCKECGMPLRVIKGGDTVVMDDGKPKIATVHIWGCMSPKCSLSMQEQGQTQTEPRASFQV